MRLTQERSNPILNLTKLFFKFVNVHVSVCVHVHVRACILVRVHVRVCDLVGIRILVCVSFVLVFMLHEYENGHGLGHGHRSYKDKDIASPGIDPGCSPDPE